MYAIIDRFEGKYAVLNLKDGSTMNICKKKIPDGAKEGDVLSINEKIEINIKKTDERNVKIKKLTNDIWND